MFDATHAEILRWFADGDVDGLRVDHPDGLRDPAGYLRAAARGRARTPGSWWRRSSSRARSCRTGRSTAPPATTRWPRSAASSSTRPPRRSSTPRPPTSPAADVLAGPGARDQARRRHHAAAPPSCPGWPRWPPEVPAAAEALAELAACFPVYRSYLPVGARHLAEARGRGRPPPARAAGSRTRSPPGCADPADELAVRFQQFTGAVMAKGVEDTAFYRWTRFIARNEVGGDPDRFGVPPEEFHAGAGPPAAAAPGRDDHAVHPRHQAREDVRARLAVLAELPGDWTAAVRRWSRGRAAARPGARRTCSGRRAVGAWPIERGAAAGVLREGGPGGAHAAPAGATRTRRSRPRCTLVDRIYDDPGRCARRRPTSPPRSSRPGWSTRWARSWCS